MLRGCASVLFSLSGTTLNHVIPVIFYRPPHLWSKANAKRVVFSGFLSTLIICGFCRKQSDSIFPIFPISSPFPHLWSLITPHDSHLASPASPGRPHNTPACPKTYYPRKSRLGQREFIQGVSKPLHAHIRGSKICLKAVLDFPEISL